MTFSRLPVLFFSFLLLLLLTACGGSDGGGDSTPDPKPPSGGDDPVAINDSATTTVNTAVKIVVLANDAGGNGAPFEVQIVTNPTKGRVSVNSQNDVVTYTPNKGVTGSDSFKYTFTDSKGARSNQAQVDITIKAGVTKPPVDDKPVARNDSATTPAGTPVKIVVLANDTGGSGAPFEVQIVTKPTKGTVSVNNQSDAVTYTPNKGATGSDSFKYSFTDSKGVVSNTATVTVTIACASIHPSDNYRAIGDSITAGKGDNISSDDVTADGCYKGRGYPPVLIDKLNSKKGRKHTVVNKGVPGDTSLAMARSINSLIAGESMHVLVLIGTNDSSAEFSPRISVSGFRRNMQDIINSIASAGKSAYLAKIPPVLGETTNSGKYANLDKGERNVLIREYNRVIDELVNPGENVFSGPDFYNFFKNKPDLYFDNVHMNGHGYKSMADLWSQKL